MKKDKREQIMALADEIAQRNYRLDFDQLTESQRALVRKIAEQQWEEAQQARFEFYNENR